MNDELRKQLEIAEAEDAYVAAKEKHGRDSKQAQAAKATMHEVRDPYRRARQAVPGDGGAVASPESITVKTEGN